MKQFTAKQFHETPRLVYQAAVKSAVKVTHAHHGDFILKLDTVVVNESTNLGNPFIVDKSELNVKYTTTKDF